MSTKEIKKKYQLLAHLIKYNRDASLIYTNLDNKYNRISL